MVQTMWADGDPVAVALDFFSLAASEKARDSLGPKVFMRFIAAIAAASMHNVLMGSASLHPRFAAPAAAVQNVMRTAVEIERLTRGRKTSGKDSQLKDLKKAAGRASPGGSGSSRRPADGVAKQARQDGSSGSSDRKKEASTSANRAQAAMSLSHGGSGGSPTVAPRGVTRAQGVSANTRSRVGDRGGRPDKTDPASEGHAAAEAQPSRLPLPLLQDILCLLDARSATAAALTCKHFGAAHRLNAFLELSAPFEAYLQAMQVGTYRYYK